MLPMLIVLVIGTVLNAVYFPRTVICIYRPANLSTEHIPVRKRRVFIGVMVLFAAFHILLGLWSMPVTTAIKTGLAMFL